MTNHVHPQAVRDRFTAAMRELSELMPLALSENGARLVDAVQALERDRDRVVDPRDAEIARLRNLLRRLANAADAVGVQFFDTDDMSAEVEEMQSATLKARAALNGDLCSDCPPVGYPTDETRCGPCPRAALKGADND